MPNYVNGYAVQSSAYTLPFDARGAADTIKVPVLIVHSEEALTPTSLTLCRLWSRLSSFGFSRRARSTLRYPEAHHSGSRCYSRILRRQLTAKRLYGRTGRHVRPVNGRNTRQAELRHEVGPQPKSAQSGEGKEIVTVSRDPQIDRGT